MGRIQRFEDIEAWKTARQLTKAVYKATREPPFSKDRDLASQIQRAAVSVMSNIAEGFDSNSKPEFAQFLNYARRSTGEVQFHLYVALDQAYISESCFATLYEQAQTARRMVVSFMGYLRTDHALKSSKSSWSSKSSESSKT